jgi:chaperonin GroES
MAGQVIIPDIAPEKHGKAKVAVVSDIDNPEISPGDIMLFRKYCLTRAEF